jgi:hypothetical protein
MSLVAPFVRAAGVALFVSVLAGSLVAADAVGKRLPDAKLEGFAQTKAKSLDDYFGRVVLYEAFAFW